MGSTMSQDSKRDQQAFQQRMGGYIDFRLSDNKITNYIVVDEVRLYFEPYNSNESWQTLKDQFKYFKKRSLHLGDLEKSNFQEMTRSEQAILQLQREIKKLQIVQNVTDQEQRQIQIAETKVKGDIQKNKNQSKFQMIYLNIVEEPYDSSSEKKKQMRRPRKYRDRALVKSSISSKHQYISKVPKRLRTTQCSFRETTKISKRNKQEMLKELMLTKKKSILSYNLDKKKLQESKITNISQAIAVEDYFSLKFVDENGHNPIYLECSKGVHILALNQQSQKWVSVSDILAGKKPLSFFRIDEYNVKSKYFLASSSDIICSEQENFVSITVSPNESFIANGLIVHNRSSKILEAHRIGLSNIKIQEVEYFPEQKLADKFHEMKCSIGNVTLNTNLTFGDYNTNLFKTIFVSQPSIPNRTQYFYLSEWNGSCYQYQDYQQTLNNEKKAKYLCYYANKIYGFRKLKYLKRLLRNCHILVIPKIILEKYYFEQLKINSCFSKQQLYSQYNKSIHLPLRLSALSNDLTPDQILPIYIFTKNIQYEQLNRYLRNIEIYNDENNKYLAFSANLSESLRILPNFDGTVYRGIRYITLQNAFNLTADDKRLITEGTIRKYLLLNSYTSTSTQKSIARLFCEKGILMTIKVSKGKQIEKYSDYQREREVLIDAFTHFAIIDFDLQSEPQTIQLQQICLPLTNKPKLVFWVDDRPENNENLKKRLESQDIQIIEVLNTKIMKIILNDFFWMYRMQMRKIVIISDMVRMEDEVNNKFAGAELFYLMYEEYGISTSSSMIYCKDKTKAKENIRLKKVRLEEENIVTSEDRLFDKVQQLLALS